jgi:hypothetical protein
VKLKVAVAAILAAALAAWAGPIKVWNAGEYITAADLNAALQHLHSSVGHGHGPVITNADISASASISMTKLQSPTLVPKLWVALDDTADCSAGTCTISESIGVTSVTRASVGQYVVNFSLPRPNSAYAAIATGGRTGSVDTNCITYSRSTTSVAVSCNKDGAGFQDGFFSLMIMDLDN